MKRQGPAPPSEHADVPTCGAAVDFMGVCVGIMAKTLISFVVFLLPLSAWAQGRVLDLTVPDQPPPATKSASSEILTITSETPAVHGAVPGSPGTSWRRAPLRLRISSLDRVAYEFGQPFVVHLVVENIGKEDVSLPWSASPERVGTAPDAPLQSLGLALYADAPGLSLRMQLPFLYGAALDQGSLNVLRPGDSAEIIASGLFEALSSQERELHLAAGKDVTVKVRARLQWLYTENGKAYSPLESEPGPIVKLQARGGGAR
jgi:hypothetical protein